MKAAEPPQAIGRPSQMMLVEAVVPALIVACTVCAPLPTVAGIAIHWLLAATNDWALPINPEVCVGFLPPELLVPPVLFA